MRATFLRFVSLLLASCWASGAIVAQEVGDTVVVISDAAQVTTPSGDIVSVPRGNHFVITEIDGNRYRGECETVEGSFDSQAVAAIPAALQFFETAIAGNPGDPANYLNRAMIFTQQSVYDKALRDFNRAIELEPKYASAYYNRGILRERQGQLSEALADVAQAIRLDSGFALAHGKQGELLTMQGRLQEALTAFNRAIELRPEFARLYYNRGMTHVDLGDTKSAVADFTKAMELDPKLPEPYNNRAVVWAQQGEFNKALDDLTKAIELRPDYALAIFNRGNVQRDLGKYKEACSDYQKALEIDPKLARAHNGLAWIYATCPVDEVRNGALAIKHGEAACRLTDGKSDKYLGTLSAAYAEAGDYAQAVEKLQQAIKLNPQNLAEIRQEMLELFWQKKPYRDMVDRSLLRLLPRPF